MQPPRGITRENAVVQGLEDNPLLRQLPLDIFVPVNAQPGRIGEVRAELEEERAKVPVDAIEVVVIDHGRRTHEPRVGASALRVASLDGPPDRGLLLSLADEDHALLAVELGVAGQRDVVLAILLGERDEGNPVLLGETLNARDERTSHGSHELRTGKRLATMKTEESGHPPVVL